MNSTLRGKNQKEKDISFLTCQVPASISLPPVDRIGGWRKNQARRKQTRIEDLEKKIARELDLVANLHSPMTTTSELFAPPSTKRSQLPLLLLPPLTLSHW